jgi:hypothetical protein
MKRIILLSGFIILLFNSTFSQQRQLPIPETNHWNFSRDIDTTFFNLYSDILIDSLLSALHSGKNVYPMQGKFELPKRSSVYDNMPCIEPRGNFHSLIIKPDTTIRYTLLIRKP